MSWPGGCDGLRDENRLESDGVQKAWRVVIEGKYVPHYVELSTFSDVHLALLKLASINECTISNRQLVDEECSGGPTYLQVQSKPLHISLHYTHPDYTTLVDSHPLHRPRPLELEPASKQHFITPVVVASSTLLQKVLWPYKTEVLEAEYVLDEIYPSWWSF